MKFSSVNPCPVCGANCAAWVKDRPAVAHDCCKWDHHWNGDFETEWMKNNNVKVVKLEKK